MKSLWRRKPLFGDTVRATIASVVGQAPNALLPTVMAGTLGATGETDAFFLAFAFAAFMVNGFGNPIQQVAVPFFVAEHDSARRERLVAAVTAVVFVVGCIVVLMILAAGNALLLSAGASFVDKRALAVPLLWVFAPFMLLALVGSIWSSALNAARDTSCQRFRQACAP